VDTKRRGAPGRLKTHFEQIPIAAIQIADNRDNTPQKKLTHPRRRRVESARRDAKVKQS